MTEIREIKPIQVETVRTYVINTPQISAPTIPIPIHMGFPVVEIPGCVEARRSAKENSLEILADIFYESGSHELF